MKIETLENEAAVIRRRLHPIPDAAQVLGGIGRTTVYDLAKRGQLQLVKIGSRSFVTDESLELYLSTLVRRQGQA
jgi:predicted DNA-binding transcriptional regulator AlpA